MMYSMQEFKYIYKHTHTLLQSYCLLIMYSKRRNKSPGKNLESKAMTTPAPLLNSTDLENTFLRDNARKKILC